MDGNRVILQTFVEADILAYLKVLGQGDAEKGLKKALWYAYEFCPPF